MNYTLTIPGPIKGKHRPRFSRRGRFVSVHSDANDVSYENLVKTLWLEKHGQTMLDGPVRVAIYAIYAVPKSTSKRKREAMLCAQIQPTKKPDCDNIAKIICDALNEIAYIDDKQIVRLVVEKGYGEKPGVKIELDG